jgi:Aminoglycoside-2''-adenylyltransferase
MTAAAIVPDVEGWDAWHPAQVARLLEGMEAPWYVAGGWALDLFLGGEPREHEDLEIAVPNVRFDELAGRLSGYDLFVIVTPTDALPLAEARGRLFDTHQTWVRDRETGSWRLDVFREPSDGGTWVCRRDPAIRMPYAELVGWTADGIPFGRPEVVLLFKAKRSHEDKNELDFRRVLPRLSAERRRWLRDALAVVHPGHRWRADL